MKKTDKKKLEEFIRVDHAGERGAIKIYEGQLLALSTFNKDEKLKKLIEDMKVHEEEHSEYFEKEIHINKKWQGLSPIGSDTQQDFIETMLNNSLSLCPRGSGIDSVRFLESCYYGRVPIVITDYDYCLFGDDIHDLSFCYKIHNVNMNPTYLLAELCKIYDTPIEELEQRALAAKTYFDTIK